MTITTVKLQQQTKAALDHLKSEGQTYDQVISHILHQLHEKGIKKRLVEGYKQTAERDRKIANEWEITSQEV